MKGIYTDTQKPDMGGAKFRDSGSLGKVLYLRKYRFLNRFVDLLLLILSVDIPITVKFGKNVKLHHNCYGTVINSNTVIEDNVQIFHGVTIGRGDVENEKNAHDFKGFLIKENAILCAGCTIISSHGLLVVGKGTIIGANSVLTQSTGDYEVWAGVPAKLIKKRNIED